MADTRSERITAASSFTGFRLLVASDGRLILFVCGGNTCRSAMAEAIARAKLAAAGTGSTHPGEPGRTPTWQALSAGLTARTGQPMSLPARLALRELGVPPGRHRARQLSPDLIHRADIIYVMTAAQRDAIVDMVPAAVTKIARLDPTRDVPEPAAGHHRRLAFQLHRLVTDQLIAIGACPPPATAPA
jgi:protein-tyrosine-phosphatase